MYKWLRPGRWPNSQRPLFDEQTGALNPEALGAAAAEPAPVPADPAAIADRLDEIDAAQERFFSETERLAMSILSHVAGEYSPVDLAQAVISLLEIARLQARQLRAAILSIESIREQIKGRNNE